MEGLSINIMSRSEENMFKNLFTVSSNVDIYIAWNDVVWMLIAVILACRALLQKTDWFVFFFRIKLKEIFIFTYHLFLFPRLHSWLVFFELITPIGIYFLVIGTFVWRCTSFVYLHKERKKWFNHINSKQHSNYGFFTLYHSFVTLQREI